MTVLHCAAKLVRQDSGATGWPCSVLHPSAEASLRIAPCRDGGCGRPGAGVRRCAVESERPIEGELGVAGIRGALNPDLAHDFFLKIWENRRSIGHIRSLGNYLFRMTKNAVFDRFEHKSVQVRYERQCLAAGDFLSDDVAAKIASEDLLMIVELAVERMPEQRQRVFRLSRYERLSHQEIARELGITTKTVEYHIRTALAELRKIIAAIIVFF